MNLTEQQCEDLRVQILKSIYNLDIEEIDEQSKILENGEIEFNASFSMRIHPDFLNEQAEYFRIDRILERNKDAEEMLEKMSEEKIIELLKRKR